MQRFVVVTLAAAIGCSDDGGNKTAPDTALVEVPAAITNQTQVRILFEARGNANAFLCTLDGQTSTCISPFEATVGDGEHTFEVAASLNANVDDTPAVHTWRVDTAAPDTSLTNAPPALDNSVTPTFEFAGTDSGGAVTFECSLDGDPFAPCTSPATLTVVDGLHAFRVRAKDEAGNVDPSPAEHGWTIDATAPETMIIAGPAAGATTGPSGAFTFGSPDTTATFECSIDGAAFAPCTSPHAFTLGDGPHTFTVRARDEVGIVDPSPPTRAWTVDAVAPPVTITSTPANPSNQSTPTFAFTSTDATATFECQVDGVVAFAACSSPFTTPALSDGSKTFRVRAIDPVGNVGTAATFAWVVDTIAPTVTLTGQPAALSNDTTPTVSFTTSGSPIGIECRVDAGAFAACTSPFTSAALADGMHAITVRATDAAGNQGSATTATFVIDTTPPSATITGQPAALSNDTTPTVTFTTAGSPVSTQCQLDSGAFATCSSPFTTSAGDGNHVIRVRVTDAAGNASTAATNTFTIDTVAPSVTITGQPAALSNDTTPTVTFTTSGSPSTIECRVDSGAFATCTSPFIPTVADGTHTITVRVTDAATNSSSATTNQFVVDTVAPTATFTVQPAALSNDTTPTVQFTTTDNPTVIECRLDSATFAPCTSPFTTGAGEGTHTISVRVRDGANNSSIATTNQFVIDTTGPALAFTEQAPAQWPVNYFDFRFTVGDAQTVQCSLDGAAFTTCTSPHTVTVAYGTSHTLRVRGIDAVGNPTTITSATWTPTQGLVLHYPWEQGDTDNTSLLKQRPSHSPDGITAAIADFVGGWAGSALGDTLATGHQYAGTIRPLTSSPDATYTASFWIRSTDAASAQQILSTVGANGGGLRVSLTGGSQLTFTAFEGGTQVQQSTTIAENRWVHVGMRTTGVGKGLEVFVDGSPRFALQSISGFNSGQAANLTVGPWSLLDVDDLRFYNRAMSNTEMCTVLARGTIPPTGGACVPLSPGFEIDFEGGQVVDTGVWGMLLVPPDATNMTFTSHTLGDFFQLKTAFDMQYSPNGPAFSQLVTTVPGRSFSFEFIPGAAFGRIIDMTRPCSLAAAIPCGIAVSYSDNDQLSIFTGTSTEQKTTVITTAGGLVPDRFNNVVVTEQRGANGTVSLSVFVNLQRTTIPITGGDLYSFVGNTVGLVDTPGIVVDEYEFWGADLSTSVELLCENGADGEYDVVTNTCTTTYGP